MTILSPFPMHVPLFFFDFARASHVTIVTWLECFCGSAAPRRAWFFGGYFALDAWVDGRHGAGLDGTGLVWCGWWMCV